MLALCQCDFVSFNLTGQYDRFTAAGKASKRDLYYYLTGMEELLRSLITKHVEVSFGSNGAARGRITDVKQGVLYMDEDEGRSVFVAISNVTIVCETKETPVRPGFVI